MSQLVFRETPGVTLNENESFVRKFIKDIRENNKLSNINPSNAELNPICHFLALLGGHHILHISRIRVKVEN